MCVCVCGNNKLKRSAGQHLGSTDFLRLFAPAFRLSSPSHRFVRRLRGRRVGGSWPGLRGVWAFFFRRLRRLAPPPLASNSHASLRPSWRSLLLPRSMPPSTTLAAALRRLSLRSGLPTLGLPRTVRRVDTEYILVAGDYVVVREPLAEGGLI